MRLHYQHRNTSLRVRVTSHQPCIVPLLGLCARLAPPPINRIAQRKCPVAPLAPSSHDGMFAQRDPLLYAPCLLSDPKSSPLTCYVLLSREYWTHRQTKWPLHQRGWVMQERMLALRKLCFGPFLSCECREAERVNSDTSGRFTFPVTFFNLLSSLPIPLATALAR